MIGVCREGGVDGGSVTPDFDGAKEGVEAGTGGAGEREDGAEGFFEALRLAGGWADCGEIEVDARVEFRGESGVIDQVEEAIQVGQISSEGESNASADNGPDRHAAGNGRGMGEQVRGAGGAGFVLRDGGADGFGGAGDREVRRQGNCAGRWLAEVAAGDEEELAAIPGDQEAGRMAKRFEHESGSGRQFGVERRCAEPVEIEPADEDGGGCDAGGHVRGDGLGRRGAARAGNGGKGGGDRRGETRAKH